jgi:uncharacterized protein involved in response to NO
LVKSPLVQSSDLHIRPHLAFYGLAALQALWVIPATLLLRSSGSQWQGWGAGDWHAHEMIFGFALAIMGGYFSGKLGSGKLWQRQVHILLGAWLLGRVSIALGPVFRFDGLGEVSALGGLLYPILLFATVGLPMVRSAKTFRNSVFGLLLGALALAECAFLLPKIFVGEFIFTGVGRAFVFIIVMMVFTMGGRITAAASSGAHQALGRRIHGLAQIGLERYGLILLTGLVIALVAGVPDPLISILCLGLFLVVSLRLYRWRFWQLRDPSVLFLHVGFSWLALGFAVMGLQSFVPGLQQLDPLHAVTVGALGTFTINVMARTTLQKARQILVLPKTLWISLLSINGAGLLRLSAFAFKDASLVLLGSAIFWELAWSLFFLFLIRTWLEDRSQ